MNISYCKHKLLQGHSPAKKEITGRGCWWFVLILWDKFGNIVHNDTVVVCTRDEDTVRSGGSSQENVGYQSSYRKEILFDLIIYACMYTLSYIVWNIDM